MMTSKFEANYSSNTEANPKSGFETVVSSRFKANAIQFNNRQTVRIVDDCLNYHARLNTNYHALLIDVVVLSLYLFGREIYIALLLLLYFNLPLSLSQIWQSLSSNQKKYHK